MPAPDDLFEMRRLEALSNTIFGVAMTLLAYNLPKASGLSAAPDWTELARTYAPHVVPLMLSFIIAGVFWFSHQRRLAMAPQAGRGVVFLNLLFLLSIIVLPATNGLYGNLRDSTVVAVLYGLHLTVIAALNAVLWLLALRGQRHFDTLAGAFLPVVVFLLGTATAVVAPAWAPYFWSLAFAAPLLGYFSRRRREA
ncbi:TMEM175 family protein [Rhodopseudomonas sp. P2A-2r]|uniref:TMEM175 family protein n=1 Tax=Rhodopseudomonas sp. P2A-2r TaxID=2991972 RepID=UPI002234BF8C|nr:TMEM175 family protein [Rhodopseudomonas sp. P2A-2r]UZE46678.1 TMEM175 family protein [Rhodopseudomonas sp. P2A-2r]